MAKTTMPTPNMRTSARSDAQKALFCAANNADLYQAVFHSHGLADRRTEALWSSDAVAPPYYSNLTTLKPDATEQQVAEIRRLRARLDGPLSVKDGFDTLDLTGDGFHVLFSASWVWAEPSNLRALVPPRWSRIRDAAALERWEQSWKASGSTTTGTVFTPALLNDANVAVYGRQADDGFDAGCVANRSPAVVGISNIFGPPGAAPVFAEAISAAATAFSPDLPLVGYDHGAALNEMIGPGFQSVGQLRIWLSDDAPASF